MDKELAQHKWQAFVLDEIFDIRATQSSIDKKNLVNLVGTIPYITRSEKNNGIDMFIGEQLKYKKDEGNVLTIGLDTQTIFYQPLPFYTGQNIQVIRHPRMNRYNASFLIVAIKILLQKFNWGGNGATLTRLKRSKVFLPITDKKEIDWQFMEEYMRRKENLLLKPAIEKLCKRLIHKEILGGGKLLRSQWKHFSFTEVFTEIQRGKRLKKADLTEGTVPYVSSTALNNGVDGFIGNEGSVRKFEDCITIANSGSVGSAFFHKYKFVASDHVTQLKRKGLDKYAYLFMVPIINRLSEKYSFNREINDERIKREKILLPINDKGEIDFDFMSSFMQEVEADILKTTLKVFKKRLNVNENKMGGVKWKAFFLEEIARIASGKDIYERERTSGQTPYVTATANNNGIGYFVGNQNETLERGCLSVNRNGSVGYCFYHPYDALYGNDTRKLKPIRSNKYVSLFISMCITNQRAKYGYGYKMGTGRLKRQKILLPIDANNQPNWNYMETYMQNLEQRQILEYLRHIERKNHTY